MSSRKQHTETLVSCHSGLRTKIDYYTSWDFRCREEGASGTMNEIEISVNKSDDSLASVALIEFLVIALSTTMSEFKVCV